MSVRIRSSALAVVVMGNGIAVAAAPVPVTPDDFTNYVAQQFMAALPDYEVNVLGPLTLRVTPPGSSNGFQANLDRVHDFCVRNRGGCAQVLGQFVQQASTTLRNT